MEIFKLKRGDCNADFVNIFFLPVNTKLFWFSNYPPLHRPNLSRTCTPFSLLKLLSSIWHFSKLLLISCYSSSHWILVKKWNFSKTISITHYGTYFLIFNQLSIILTSAQAVFIFVSTTFLSNRNLSSWPFPILLKEGIDQLSAELIKWNNILVYSVLWKSRASNKLFPWKQIL